MSTLALTDLFPVGRGAGAFKVTYKDMLAGVVSVGTTPPATPSAGLLWYNTNKGALYTYDGTFWVG